MVVSVRIRLLLSTSFTTGVFQQERSTRVVLRVPYARQEP
jgi:hypothetical protein